MITLTRWNPMQEMEALHNRLSSIVGLAPLRNGGTQEGNVPAAEWTPLVDITEDENEYLLTVELSEVKKEDVKVGVEDRVLSITGERKIEKLEKNKRYHRVERAYGSFVRRFTLPEDADAEKVSAEFKEGLLKVRLAKSETAKPKTIEVKFA